MKANICLAINPAIKKLNTIFKAFKNPRYEASVNIWEALTKLDEAFERKKSTVKETTVKKNPNITIFWIKGFLVKKPKAESIAVNIAGIF